MHAPSTGASDGDLGKERPCAAASSAGGQLPPLKQALAAPEDTQSHLPPPPAGPNVSLIFDLIVAGNDPRFPQHLIPVKLRTIYMRHGCSCSLNRVGPWHDLN